MKRLWRFTKRKSSEGRKQQDKGAQRALLEELFQDMYDYRGRIYKLNFIRGLMFGLGSALGGTVVLAALVWMASQFVDYPVIGETVRETLETVNDSGQ